ncbi:MAG TPA: outer membrane lipoprotein carrier protein LolA [Candidatus Angelobacter sp.]|nr:outer membrane lipoprotein carrier protein LolA [Candidatus Angelobacter sp.]
MRKLSLTTTLFLASALAMAQAKAPAAAQNGPGSGDLKSVLAKMNLNAGTFKSAQADVEFETYESVVQEKTLQKGRIYFRKTNKGVEAAFDITSPAPKQVVFDGKDVTMCEPRIDQCTRRDVSKNKADVESFLSLGFGASGDELQKSYEVTLDGWEKVHGIQTARLELAPKNEKLRQTYSKIILWIEPEKDILLQQRFNESSGNYRLTRYANMKVNGRLPEDAFKLKTSSNTKIVRSQ